MKGWSWIKNLARKLLSNNFLMFSFITAQKIKFYVRDYFNKCNQTADSCGFCHIYDAISNENLIVCAVFIDILEHTIISFTG